MCQTVFLSIPLFACAVIAESQNGSLTVPCPFTDENGVSDVLSQITVYKQIYTPLSTPAVASIDKVAIISVSRTVGLNPEYHIQLDASAENGQYHVIFHGAAFTPHEPPMGYGGANPIGGFD